MPNPAAIYRHHLPLASPQLICCPPTRAMKGGIFIHEDNRRPSPRQLHVIELMAKGFKNREIAKKLGMSKHVVRNYLGIIYDKVGVSNRVELALWCEARVHEGKFRRKAT
jgi:DNA-binding NarL/FixJ family response regulator